MAGRAEWQFNGGGRPHRTGFAGTGSNLELRGGQSEANLDREGQFRAAINPARARQIRHRSDVETDMCIMCSELCAIKLVSEAMDD